MQQTWWEFLLLWLSLSLVAQFTWCFKNTSVIKKRFSYWRILSSKRTYLWTKCPRSGLKKWIPIARFVWLTPATLFWCHATIYAFAKNASRSWRMGISLGEAYITLRLLNALYAGDRLILINRFNWYILAKTNN